MTQRLCELVRKIEASPWNRPGTDKTWVLGVLREHQRFRGEVARARRVARR